MCMTCRSPAKARITGLDKGGNMSRILRHNVGPVEVTVLTDGKGQFTHAHFPDTDPAQIDALLATAGKEVIETEFNAFMVRNGDEVTLIDTGAGTLMGPIAGHLPQALAEAGVTPDQVTRIFITHMHPDHCGGAITAVGQPAFKNASLAISAVEHAHYSNPDDFTGRGARAEDAFRLAETVFAAYADRIQPLSGAAEIAAGLTMVPLHGHTKGHSGVHIVAGSDELMIVADIIHAVDLQLADPGVAVMFDMDSDMAATARKHMLDQLARDGIACTGGHFLYPGIRRIERAGAGYRFTA